MRFQYVFIQGQGKINGKIEEVIMDKKTKISL